MSWFGSIKVKCGPWPTPSIDNYLLQGEVKGVLIRTTRVDDGLLELQPQENHSSTISNPWTLNSPKQFHWIIQYISMRHASQTPQRLWRLGERALRKLPSDHFQSDFCMPGRYFQWQSWDNHEEKPNNLCLRLLKLCLVLRGSHQTIVGLVVWRSLTGNPFFSI